jgi:hypothetical protein
MIGTAAKLGLVRNSANTITNVKAVVGNRYIIYISGIQFIFYIFSKVPSWYTVHVFIIDNSVFNENNLLNHFIYFFVLYILIKKVLLMLSSIFSLADEKFYEIAKRSPAKVRSLTLSHR